MNTKVDKKLLFRYFSGLTTPLENAGIRQWLELGENEELFYLYLENWERSNAQYIPVKDQVFSKFREKLEFKGQPGSTQSKNSWHLKTMSISRTWWSIAVSFLLVVGIAILAKDRILYKNYSTQYGETMTIVLSDESKVILNANTQVKVPRWFAYSDNREVWMSGEAFFNISKKEDHQKFIVHTNKLDVEVLGTRFNVTDRHNATRVVLQEGKVKVVTNKEDGDTAMLEESGDYAEVNEESTKIITRTVDESLHTAWQEKRLKFKETAVSEVLQTIEDYYGVGVGSSDTTLYDRKFSGTLPNNDLNIILQALSNIYGTEFIQLSQK